MSHFNEDVKTISLDCFCVKLHSCTKNEHVHVIVMSLIDNQKPNSNTASKIKFTTKWKIPKKTIKDRLKVGYPMLDRVSRHVWSNYETISK
ncbi:hypothetical protein AKO1_007792 [Acrasis kona]|uniref:Uncharacterized protein n=1 Tax=Acrasis kona TaxID=1008807 RepID=A0AAW2YQV3_9EUKA